MNPSSMTQLPDDSGCFTATILSQAEIDALPIKKRPICARISSEMYHAVFENIGAASMAWEPRPTGVFDSELASKVAVELCFIIANEIEKREYDALVLAANIVAKEIDHCAAPVSHQDLASAKQAILDESEKFA